MKQFEANGYDCTHDSEQPDGEIAVINTCGFIETAKEESINTILQFVEAKKEGRLNKLFVMGCLSERYKNELENEIPEVDKSMASSITSSCWLIWERLKSRLAAVSDISRHPLIMHTSK